MSTPLIEPDRVLLQARNVEFDWSTLPLHWVPGDPFSTHVLNVLHLLLPAGGVVRRDVQGGAAAHRGRTAARRRRGIHRPGIGALPRSPGGTRATRVEGSRSHPVHGPDAVAVRPVARPATADRTARGELPRRAARHHRRRRARHRVPRGLGPQCEGPRRGGHRSDHARPAALARRRGGRASQRRLRRDALLRPRGGPADPHPAPRHPGPRVVVDPRCPIPHGPRPGPGACIETCACTPSFGLAGGESPRHATRPGGPRQAHVAVLPPLVPPEPRGLDRSGGPLSGVLPAARAAAR